MSEMEGTMGRPYMNVPDPMLAMTGSVQMHHTLNSAAMGNKPYIEIQEQPRPRGLRFRYKCEGRSAGTIPGESSTQEHRTYPTIKICNHSGPSAIVVVSCVTKDDPPRPHPHSLVGKDCKQGVCTVKLKGSNTVSFPSLGIQCATKKEIQESLNQRAKIRVDPWGTGYHKNVNSIELSTVRLAFQAFLPDSHGKYTSIVQPTASQCIYDKKAVTDLVICRLSKQSGSAKGGDEVFMLCEKVTKDDIQVRFFEETKDEGVKWEKYGVFGQQDVHRQVAIVFKTPEYMDQAIKQPVTVYVQLRRPSDDEVSDPKPFQYIPNDPDPDFINRKRKRKNLNFDHFFKDSKIPMQMVPEEVQQSTKDTIKERLIKKANRNQNVNRTPGQGISQYDMPHYSIDNTGGATGDTGMLISSTNYNTAMEHHHLNEVPGGGGSDSNVVYYMEDGTTLKQEVISPQQNVVMQDGQSYTEMITVATTTANGQGYGQGGAMPADSPKGGVMLSPQQHISSVTLNHEGVVVENNGGSGGGPVEPVIGGGSIYSMLKDSLQNAEGIVTNSLPSLPSAVFENFNSSNLANNMAYLQGESGMVAAEETVESINEDVPHHS